MNKRSHVLKYLISDFITAGSAWTLFFIFRKLIIETRKFGYDIPVEFGTKYYLGLAIIPVFWLLFYYLSGYYKNIYKKSRIIELGQTLLVTIIGVLLIFFTLILDDTNPDYTYYYYSILALFTIHFLLTYIPRLIITTKTTRKIHNRIIGFNTLIVGSNERAVELFKDFNSMKKSTGNKFIGFVNVHEKKSYLLEEHLPHLGKLKQIREIIIKHNVEEVIVAIESSEHDQINRIINILNEKNVIIKVIPNMYDILTGTVKMSSIFGAPLIQISHDLMPTWEENLKRILDVIFSAILLILCIPLYIGLGFAVKLTSKGPIFYSHERIGRYGKPFTIFKFRSMCVDAERHGPALSKENDDRITKVGKFMRKTRLDEFPQFYNVFIGDMSFVGPRPERQFFMDQILEKAPHYVHLLKVRPGITSWGQVKYGYAENVTQMIQRLKYDIIYIENMSLIVDMKILIYTIKTVIQGSGK